MNNPGIDLPSTTAVIFQRMTLMCAEAARTSCLDVQQDINDPALCGSGQCSDALPPELFVPELCFKQDSQKAACMLVHVTMTGFSKMWCVYSEYRQAEGSVVSAVAQRLLTTDAPSETTQDLAASAQLVSTTGAATVHAAAAALLLSTLLLLLLLLLLVLDAAAAAAQPAAVDAADVGPDALIS